MPSEEICVYLLCPEESKPYSPGQFKCTTMAVGQIKKENTGKVLYHSQSSTAVNSLLLFFPSYSGGPGYRFSWTAQKNMWLSS